MSLPANPKLAQRKQRLIDLMVQKVSRDHQRAGYDPLDEEQLGYVQKEVIKMFETGNVSHTDLNRLQLKLRTMIGSGQALSITLQPINTKAITAQGSRTDASSTREPVPASLTSVTYSPKGPRLVRCVADDPWAQIAISEAKEFEQRKRAEVQRTRILQQQQKQILDEQVKKRVHVRQAVVEHSKIYAVQQAEQQKKWMAEMEILEERRKEKFLAEKTARDQQLKENIEKRKRELEQRRKEDEILAERLKEDIRMEKEIEIEKRQKARADVARFLQYNQKQKALTASIAQAEIESDRRHQEEFLAKLAKEEDQRSLALAQMFSRQARQADMAAAMQKNFEEQAQIDEQKAKIVQENIARKQDEAEQRRVNKVKADRERLKMHLAEQLKIKEIQREKEREEAEVIKVEMQKQAKEEAEQAKVEREQRRELDRQYRKSLEQQIRERMAVVVPVMTETEMRLNRSLLPKA